MNKKILIDWLVKCEEKYKSISDNFETFDYQKGLIDGAKIAISSVIEKLKKEDN
ncbi:hypothetical protein [Enterococcus lactis]|uniref:hypothetical protein n=1 Tax=Enterococcus lactis TaxID=357441 RepID=UPI0012E23200|nr:hypothetical protein [Enterococcus lactis]EGP4828612.1 hypothetical protein [Enterococcus faecium]EGP5038257.1 hypothetical protein [Enterococcus faecium]EMF0488578.1 hypothetical protein [Enterococcus faecium]MUP22446.1 hypothetical protein [Enterococcus lactis]NTQ57603.1 hypothetical protein [Enterococcus faecium]